MHKKIEYFKQKKIEYENKLSTFKEKYTESEYTKECPDMALSKGALKALEILNDSNNKKFFENKIASNSETIIAYRIYFMLLDREEFYSIPNDEVFFEKVCSYFLENSTDGKIGKEIML